MELDSFFNPARKHQLEQLNRIEVAREDVREAGDEPIDLDAGVARLTRRMQDSGSAGGPAD